MEDSTIRSVYSFVGGTENAFESTGLEDLTVRRTALAGFDDYFAPDCPNEVVHCLLDATSSNCTVNPSNNLLSTDALFCSERDADLSKGMMRLDSPPSIMRLR